MTSALRRLERWLETMRLPAGGPHAPPGYGGPVVHWWRDSLDYTGPGFDWRYEGIICGYLTLYDRTGDAAWLQKARRAGEDLCAAQLPSGNYQCSAFEQNPATSGTPHEAAADSGLLALAATLRRAGDASWERYLETAQRNVQNIYVERLWDTAAESFRDHPARATFVPNKAATLIEALVLLSELTGEGAWLTRYARPTLEQIVRHQVRRRGDPLDGAIAQNTDGPTLVRKYFPYYVARCIPALLEGSRRLGEPRFLEAALAAGAFLLRSRDPDGGWPQVLYPGGRVNRYPRWVAATGDILRTLELLQPHGLSADLGPTRRRLLGAQLPSGAFPVAEGFAWMVGQRPGGASDARDEAPVVGWNDKAFRYLAGWDEP